MIKIKPNQKAGMETPKRAPTVAILSINEFFFIAAITPRGTAVKIAMNIATMVNSIVAGSLSVIKSITGLR